MEALIVQARLNFDDPIVGVFPVSYDGMAEAQKRAISLDKKPASIGKFVDAIDVTGYVGITIYYVENMAVPFPVQSFGMHATPASAFTGEEIRAAAREWRKLQKRK